MGDLEFAATSDGLRLPIIDVTNSAFAIPDDPTSAAQRRDTLVAWDRRNRWMPTIITRLLMRSAARRSLLLQRIMQAHKGYLDSITTYMLKLGPEHLPPGYDGPIDQKVAAAPHVAMVRLRMQQLAWLMADALVTPLTEASRAPLHLVNIAGGPALDSINALLILARSGPLLSGRSIAIHVFDAEQAGPDFGSRALRALMEPGKPLHGLEIRFQLQPYDWNDTRPLAEMLSELVARGAVLAASSEGGLFEYGTDEAIVANLRAFAEARVPVVVGSVTSSSDLRKRMIAQAGFQIYPRGLEGFAPLCERGGYSIAESRSAIVSEQVLLRPRTE